MIFNVPLCQQQKRKLRLYISNTFNPARPDADDSDGSIASWELRVEGKLLDDVSFVAQWTFYFLFLQCRNTHKQCRIGYMWYPVLQGLGCIWPTVLGLVIIFLNGVRQAGIGCLWIWNEWLMSWRVFRQSADTAWKAEWSYIYLCSVSFAAKSSDVLSSPGQGRHFAAVWSI